MPRGPYFSSVSTITKFKATFARFIANAEIREPHERVLLALVDNRFKGKSVWARNRDFEQTNGGWHGVHTN